MAHTFTAKDSSAGGKARAAELSDERRSEIARAGAKALWANGGPKKKAKASKSAKKRSAA